MNNSINDEHKTKEQLIKEYVKQFGGFPYFLFMGAEDKVIISAIEKALETKEEISVDDDNKDY